MLYLYTIIHNNRWMYWADENDLIQKASMDGKNIITLHNTALSHPYALAVDYGAQMLYWSDIGYHCIESSNTDGSNRKIITNFPSNPYSMVIFEGNLYWSDSGYQRVYSISLNTSSITDVSGYVMD